MTECGRGAAVPVEEMRPHVDVGQDRGAGWCWQGRELRAEERYMCVCVCSARSCFFQF